MLLKYEGVVLVVYSRCLQQHRTTGGLDQYTTWTDQVKFYILGVGKGVASKGDGGGGA